MSAAQHQRNGGGLHTAEQLGDGKARLHIAAHGIENDQQAADALVLFDGDQLGNDVLVLGGLVLRGQDIVSLDLPDDGKTVDLVPAAFGGDAAGVIDFLAAAFLLLGRTLLGLFLVSGGVRLFVLRHGCGSFHLGDSPLV